MQWEIWLPAAPGSAPRARTLVREAAAECGIGGDAAWALMLATTEAVANAVEHGTACGGGEGTIALVIESLGDELCVEVRDCGSFRAPSSRPPAEPNRGRGLPLMRAVVDHLELEPGTEQTRVHFRKRAA